MVQDPLELAKARAAWAPVDRLGAKIDGYGQQMDQHGKEMEALGKEMDRAAGRMEFGSMEAISRRMHEAGEPMDALGKQIEQENRAADAAVRELIRDALARGLAQPAPVQG